MWGYTQRFSSLDISILENAWMNIIIVIFFFQSHCLSFVISSTSNSARGAFSTDFHIKKCFIWTFNLQRYMHAKKNLVLWLCFFPAGYILWSASSCTHSDGLRFHSLENNNSLLFLNRRGLLLNFFTVSSYIFVINTIRLNIYLSSLYSHDFNILEDAL